MVAAVPFMLVFRFLHIVSGALWVGSAFLFVGIIGPSAAEVGPSAGPLLHVAVKKRKVVQVITGLGAVTVIAGWVMWLRDMSQASLGDWLSSRFGLVLTIGGVLASVTLFVGYLEIGRRVERLVDVGDEIAASGGPPSAAQQAEVEQLGAAMEKFGKIDLTLLLLPVTAMSTARYW
jgi:ribose/xylose/arabinose/galactoside ABC-type transport system permease subunit